MDPTTENPSPETENDDIIPALSRDLYYKEYTKLLQWLEQKEILNITEPVMLAYMTEISKVYKSSTLWCIHSKLQALLRLKKGIDLASYYKLHAFMQDLSKNIEPRKPLVFTEEDLYKFFIEAPDNTYLFVKVVAICGIFGACRRYEMCNLRLCDITNKGSVLIITIQTTRPGNGRKFAVIDESNIKYAQIFMKYLLLRPEKVNSDRVFLKYTNGQCIRQVVGVNTFGKCPSLIAKYLKLPEANNYSGHAFRQTSATIMANGAMNVVEIKRRRSFKSSELASKESMMNNTDISKLISRVFNKGGNGTTPTSSHIELNETTLSSKDIKSASTNETTSANLLEEEINELDHSNSSHTNEVTQEYLNSTNFKEEIEMDIKQEALYLAPSDLEDYMPLHTQIKEEPPENKSQPELGTRDFTEQTNINDSIANSSVQPKTRDDSEVYGEYITMKLKNYDSRTKSIVQHLVNEIIFKADMGEYKSSS